MTENFLVPSPPGGWREPWPRVFELATALPVERWALVGGLMVQAHALAVGVETVRVTIDVDVAVRIEAGVADYSASASALNTLGYTLDVSTAYTYRFTRGADVVDLMVPDHERPTPRYARRDVMEIQGGQQAMGRLQLMRFDHNGKRFDVPVPNPHGALVLKAAALRVDHRDRGRHLLDGITLLACITDVDPIVANLRGSDRKRLSFLLDQLDEQLVIAAQAPADTAALARRTAGDLRRGLTGAR